MKSLFVSVVGRTNVGKSTMVNRMIGEKVLIMSDKPQTTRSKITGIYNDDEYQIVFIDTPGLHHPENKLSERMVEEAQSAVTEGDLILFVAEARMPGKIEKDLIEEIRKSGVPCLLALNKIDLVAKEELLPVLAAYGKLYDFAAFYPVSAVKNEGVAELFEEIKTHAVETDTLYYDRDYSTDRSERFEVCELIREQLLLLLHDEVPHGIAVETVLFRDREDGVTEIYTDIICEKESHKGIIIGKQGQMLKTVSTRARKEIESLLGRHVFLECRVKVKEDWRNNDKLVEKYNEF